MTVWADPHRIVDPDTVHSTETEYRDVVLGLSEKLRLLVLPNVMKRSVSSVLAERIKQRRAVTPAKHKVRYVKFYAGRDGDRCGRY
jgi:uncharacterized DUF497 family protein